MASRFGYEYGMGEPTMGLPSTIADFMQQRQQYQYGQQRLYEANQAAAFQQRNDLARQQAMDEQELETQVRANRLGLNGLGPMLTDPYSQAYESADAEGNVYDGSISMSVSPNAQTAPDPIERKSVGLGLSRIIRPEFAEAQKAMRSEDFANNKTYSPYDNPQRARETDIEEINTITRALANMSKTDQNYSVLQTRLSNLLANSQPSAPKEALGGGAVPATASKPSATEASGELKVSVEPASEIDPKATELLRKYKAQYPTKSDEEILAAMRRKGLI